MAKNKSTDTPKATARKNAKTTPHTKASKGKDATKARAAKSTSRTEKDPVGDKTARTSDRPKPHPKSGQTVTADRRRIGDRRASDDRRKKQQPVAVERRKIERRAKVNRRRQIDPTTCERDYTREELEFMSALDEYKRTSGRMFPTCSEILEVIAGLGYQKIDPGDTNTPLPAGDTPH